MRLYTYWRSSTAYRVRIALALKGLHCEMQAVDLVAGDQRDDSYMAINPSAGVPSLQLDSGEILTQSLAIIDYLEYLQPTPALLPSEPLQRARVLAASQVIACDIHPVNNSKVVAHFRQFDHTADHALQWMHHWMYEGLTAFAALIDPAGPYCFGDQLTLADICLIPQLYNAHRWGLELSSLQRLCEIEARCLELQPFRHANPQAQPDAEN